MEDQFVLETKGYCLCCLRLGPEVDGQASEPFSLQKFCKYLNVDIRKVFREAMSVSEEFLPTLERSELKGTVCGRCEAFLVRMAWAREEMEMLRMTLDYCVRSIHEEMEEASEDKEVVEVFQKEMRSHPQTLIHFGVVEHLRKEFREKCFKRMRESFPRFNLKEVDPFVAVEPGSKAGSNDDVEGVIPVINIDDSPPSPDIEILEEPPEEPVPVGPVKRSVSTTPIKQESVGQDNTFGAPDAWPTVGDPDSQDDSKTKCNICQSLFSCFSRLQEHRRTVHLGMRFKCTLCPKTFMTSDSLRRHVIGNHKRVVNRQWCMKQLVPVVKFEDPMPQPNASASLPPPPVLQPRPPLPVLQPRPPGPEMNVSGKLECSICHKQFRRQGLLADHMNTAHSGLRFKCDSCSATFMYRASWYKHHRKYHKAAGPLKPPIPVKTNGRKRFRCPLCPSQYTNKLELSQHKKSAHVGMSFKCDYCPATFTLNNNKRKHERRAHSKPAPDRTSPKKPTLNDSFLEGLFNVENPSPSKKRPFQCEHCEKSYDRRSRLDDHVQSVHRGNRFQCDLCPSTFALRSSLQRHHQSFHGQSYEGQTLPQVNNPTVADQQNELQQPDDSSNDAVSMEVSLDPRTFLMDETSGDSRIRRPSGNDQFTCKICHKSFASNSRLTDHHDIIHLGKRFRCDLCTSVFMQRSSLFRHRRQSHKGCAKGSANATYDGIQILPTPTQPSNLMKKYKCNLCPKQFSSSLFLISHKKAVHFGLKIKTEVTSAPPSQPDPPLAFDDPGNFEEPSTSAAGALNFSSPSLMCDLCNKVFKGKQCLTDHRKAVHFGDPYKCPNCPRTFISKSSLNKHHRLYPHHRESLDQNASSSVGIIIPLQEPEPVPQAIPIFTSTPLTPDPPQVADVSDSTEFKCDLCSKDFRSLYSLQEHQQAVHFGRKIQCDLCSATFSYLQSLRQHKRKFHDVNSPDNQPQTIVQHRAPAPTPSPIKRAVLEGNRVRLLSGRLLKLYKCDLCDKEFNRPSKLSDHIQVVHLGNLLKCMHCTERFRNRQALSNHLKQYHPDHADPDDAVPGTSASSRILIQNSEWIELNQNLPQDQEDQEEVLLNFDDFIPEDEDMNGRVGAPRPRGGYEGKKTHECEFCNKVFSRRDNLNYHRDSVHLGIRYKCDFCDVSFTQKGSRNVHMRTVCPNRPQAQ